MRVVGLDPALTSFGAARCLPGKDPYVRTWRLRTTRRGHDRLEFLLEGVRLVCPGADVAVMESLAYSAGGPGHAELSGLHWMVRHELWKLGLPVAIVAPAIRAKWLTGTGWAGKDECLAAAIRRFPMVPLAGNDEADALTLAAMGCAFYGEPLVQMPAERQETLTAVNKGRPVIAWPNINHREGA